MLKVMGAAFMERSATVRPSTWRHTPEVRSYTAEKTLKPAFIKFPLLPLKISFNFIFMKAPNEDLQLVAGANSVVLPTFQTLFIEMCLSEGTVRATVAYRAVRVFCGPAALCMLNTRVLPRGRWSYYWL